MVVMAYATAGTLEDALDNNKFQSPAEVVRLLAGIARGMEAVHVHKIIHLDIKPHNIFLGADDTARWLGSILPREAVGAHAAVERERRAPRTFY